MANKFFNTDSEEILVRQEAVELARRQMQEQYDKKAREHAIKQKEVCLHSKSVRLYNLFNLYCPERRTLTARKAKEFGKIWNQVG